jgi:hypothetical protein
MGMDEVRSRSEGAILSVLPERAHDLARLRVLAGQGDWPVVTVVGKYNHGKSRLLNELIGANAFAVADRRETVALSARVHEQVRWLDAPGLDADPPVRACRQGGRTGRARTRAAAGAA